MLTEEQEAGFIGIGNYGGSLLALWNDERGNTRTVSLYPSPYEDDYDIPETRLD